jgi:hypothetical protein
MVLLAQRKLAEIIECVLDAPPDEQQWMIDYFA